MLNDNKEISPITSIKRIFGDYLRILFIPMWDIRPHNFGIGVPNGRMLFNVNVDVVSRILLVDLNINT